MPFIDQAFVVYNASTATFTPSSPTVALSQTVLTTLGDMEYVNNTPALARLAGNVSATKEYLSQTGNGTISAAPVWSQIAYTDISGTPQLPVAFAAVAHKWFNSYTSSTGVFTASQPVVSDLGDTPSTNQVLAGPTTGSPATATFRALVAADIPALPYLPTSTVLPSTKAAVASNWINSYSSVTGLFTATQPAFTDVSGTLVASQEPATTVNAVTNDTNITGSIATQTLTLGWTGQLSVTRGGTGLNSTSQNFAFIGPASGAGAPTWRALVAGDIPSLSYIGTGLMTTLGDIIYENATPAAARLAGNTSATIAVLTQQGNGTISAAPAWVLATGTGSPVFSVSPSFTGTMNAVNITATGTISGSTQTSTGALNVGTSKFVVNASGVVTTYNNVLLTGNGIPSEVGVVSTGTATAATAATSLLAAPVAATMYRITCYLKITVATTTPVAGPVTLTYADKDGVAQSVVMSLQNAAGAIATQTGSTTTTPIMGCTEIWANSGTAIKYAIAFSGTGTYEFNFKCEAL